MKYLKRTSTLLAASLVITMGCSPEKPPRTADGITAHAGIETPREVGTAVSDGHTSQVSLDWNGTYQGIIPCADCEGIRASVTLMRNGKFSRTVTYLGREATGRTDTGAFQWDETGSKVTLKPGERDAQMYQVGENRLFHLDRAGNRITGDLAENYQLIKNRADHRLEDKKWVLTELMGREVTPREGDRQAFLVFTSETGRISGDNGCNLLNGSYELQEGARITIGQMPVTLMACPDMEVADQFNRVLGDVDNYAIADGFLSLNRARKAPLARFRLQE